MGRGSLSYAGGWHSHPCARYVRAFLSHRLRCQSSELRRYFYERYSLEQCGSAFLRSRAGNPNMTLSGHLGTTAVTAVMKTWVEALTAIVGWLVFGVDGFAAKNSRSSVVRRSARSSSGWR